MENQFKKQIYETTFNYEINGYSVVEVENYKNIVFEYIDELENIIKMLNAKIDLNFNKYQNEKNELETQIRQLKDTIK